MMANCFDPTLMTDDVLAAYSLDPSATDAAVRSHVQQCAVCQEILSTLERENTALIRFDCPSGKRLFEYAVGLLDPVDADVVASHLQICTRCQDEYTQVQSASFPETVATSPFKALSTLPRLVASIVSAAFGSQLQPVSQTRSAKEEDVIQEYEAGTLMLSLRQLAGTTPIVMHGGLSTGDGVIARLLHAGGTTVAHEVVIQGDAFTFDEVMPGTYDLEVICTDRIVMVATLSIPLHGPSEQ